MTNKDVIGKFITNNGNCKVGNIKFEGNKLIHYNTVIAYNFVNTRIIVNTQNYSNSTTVIQKAIIEIGNIKKVYEVDDQKLFDIICKLLEKGFNEELFHKMEVYTHCLHNIPAINLTRKEKIAYNKFHKEEITRHKTELEQYVNKAYLEMVTA